MLQLSHDHRWPFSFSNCGVRARLLKPFSNCMAGALQWQPRGKGELMRFLATEGGNHCKLFTPQQSRLKGKTTHKQLQILIRQIKSNQYIIMCESKHVISTYINFCYFCCSTHQSEFLKFLLRYIVCTSMVRRAAWNIQGQSGQWQETR